LLLLKKGCQGCNLIKENVQKLFLEESKIPLDFSIMAKKNFFSQNVKSISKLSIYFAYNMLLQRGEKNISKTVL